MTPTPKEVAAKLRAAAAELEAKAKGERRTRGERAVSMADALTSRGYPANTLGDGGSRSSDPTSSTERSALADNRCGDEGPDVWRAAPFAHVDGDLSAQFRTLVLVADKMISTIGDLLSHGSDQDPLPAGSGDCIACSEFVRPTKERPWNRIVGGFCPACKRAFDRETEANGEPPDRADFCRRRMEATKVKKAS